MDRVLNHWQTVVGARCGTLHLRVSCDSDRLHDDSRIMVVDGDGYCEISRTVDNDFEPVFITFQEAGRVSAAFLIPRTALSRREVYTLQSGDFALKEVYDEPFIPVFALVNGDVMQVGCIHCIATFFVRDILTSAICDGCGRGAVRCQCKPEERSQFLNLLAVRKLRNYLTAAEHREISSSSSSPSASPRQEEAVDVVQEGRECCNDTEYEPIVGRKVAPYCVCTVQ